MPCGREHDRHRLRGRRGELSSRRDNRRANNVSGGLNVKHIYQVGGVTGRHVQSHHALLRGRGAQELRHGRHARSGRADRPPLRRTAGATPTPWAKAQAPTRTPCRTTTPTRSTSAGPALRAAEDDRLLPQCRHQEGHLSFVINYEKRSRSSAAARCASATTTETAARSRTAARGQRPTVRHAGQRPGHHHPRRDAGAATARGVSGGLMQPNLLEVLRTTRDSGC